MVRQIRLHVGRKTSELVPSPVEAGDVLLFQQVIEIEKAELWLEGFMSSDNVLPHFVCGCSLLLPGQHPQERQLRFWMRWNRLGKNKICVLRLAPAHLENGLRSFRILLKSAVEQGEGTVCVPGHEE